MYFFQTLYEPLTPKEYVMFCNISFYAFPAVIGETRTPLIYLHMYTDSNTATASMSISFKNVARMFFLFTAFRGFIQRACKEQDPVVQSIVSLTISLRHKFVKQISAKVTYTLLFFVEKM